MSKHNKGSQGQFIWDHNRPARSDHLQSGWSWAGNSQATWSGWSWGGFTFDDAAPINDGTQVIAHDGYDASKAQQAMAPFTMLERTLAPFKKDVPTAEALVRDMYFSLIKREPRDHEVPLRESYQINGELMGMLRQSPQFGELHEQSMGDSYITTQSVAQLAPQVLGNLSSETKERIQRMVEMEQQLKIMQARMEALETLRQARGNELLGQRAEQIEAELQKLREAIAAARGQISPGEQSDIRQGLASALAEATEAAKNLNAGFQALGGGLGGKNLAWAVGQTSAHGRNPLSMEQKRKLAEEILHNEKIKLVALMAGKMADIALDVQASKTEMPTDELTETRQGRNLARLLASEYSLLGDPDLELLFNYRFATGQLMEYEIVGYTPQGKGPIIVMVDNSGSMDGEPEIWSKGVMLALQMIAKMQRRDFLVIHFDSTVKKVAEFPKGDTDPDTMLNMIEYFSGGGTNFEPPMAEALKWVRQSRYEKADCIFITDGLCAINDDACKEWNEMRASRKMRAYAIVIGSTQWGGEVMKRLTDYMHEISDLSLEQTADSAVLQNIFAVGTAATNPTASPQPAAAP